MSTYAFYSKVVQVLGYFRFKKKQNEIHYLKLNVEGRGSSEIIKCWWVRVNENFRPATPGHFKWNGSNLNSQIIF